MESLARFLRGFGLPILLLLLLRTYRLLQRRKRLLKAFPNLHLGPSSLLGNAADLRRDRDAFLSELIAPNEPKVAPFLNLNRVQFACSDPATVQEVIRKSKPIGRWALVEAEVPCEDLAACSACVHDVAVHIALRETRNWHRGLLSLPEATEELVFTILLQAFFGNRALENASLIRACCVAKDELSDSLNAQAVKVFLGGRISDDDPTASRHFQKLEKLMEETMSCERENERRLPNRLKDNLSIIDIAVERGYSPATVALLLLDSLRLCSSITMWLFYFLALQKDHQAAVTKEIDNMVGRRVPPKAQEVTKLQVLDAFLAETMRLQSPIPYRVRETTEPIAGNGADIPAGSIVYAMIEAANKSLSAEFIPERSQEATIGSLSPAETFCVSIAKAITIVALQKFSVRLEKDLQPSSEAGYADLAQVGVMFDCQFTVRETAPTL